MLLTKSSQSLPELVLVNEAGVVPVVGPEDVLPVRDVLPHTGKLVEVHPTFVLPVEHGWKGTETTKVKKENGKNDLPTQVGVFIQQAGRELKRVQRLRYKTPPKKTFRNA